MKALLKKDIDWLWKAANDKVKECIFSILDDCAIATDSFRAHTINRRSLPNKVNGATISAGFDVFDNGNIVLRFLINPKFLYEAMAGFLDQPRVEITLIRTEELEGITVLADHSNNQAFVMCIKQEEENEC